MNPFSIPLQTRDPNEFMLGEKGFIPIYEFYKQTDDTDFISSVDKTFSFDNNYSIDDMYNISYHFNNYGFRSNFDYTFTEKDQIWVFGDSYTVGVGNPYDKVWINMLPKEYGTYYNLSRAGSGIYTALRYLRTCLEITTHPPKLIIVFGFYRSRIEKFVDGSYKNYGPWNAPDDLYDDVVKAEVNYDANVDDFLTLAYKNNIDVVFCPEYDPRIGMLRTDLARDVGKDDSLFLKLMGINNPKQSSVFPHGGIKTQKNYYDIMKPLIERKLK